MPPPPLLPPHPRAAKKIAAAVKPEELEELEEVVEGNGRESPDNVDNMQAGLLRLSSSLGAQRAARSRADGKVRHWEEKDAEKRHC